MDSWYRRNMSSYIMGRMAPKLHVIRKSFYDEILEQCSWVCPWPWCSSYWSIWWQFYCNQIRYLYTKDSKKLTVCKKLVDDNTFAEFYHHKCFIHYKTPFGRGYIVNCPWQGHLYFPVNHIIHAQEAYHIDKQKSVLVLLGGLDPFPGTWTTSKSSPTPPTLV